MESVRHQAIDLIAHHAALKAPEMPNIEKDSPEALEFINDLKLERYVALARVIDVVIDRTVTCAPTREHDGLLASLPKWNQREKWEQLSHDSSYTLQSDIAAVRSREIYRTAQSYTELVGRLDSRRHIKLDTQLLAGANTASRSITGLLKGVPKLLKRLAPEVEPSEYEQVARNSINLPALVALSCVNRLMAARQTISPSSFPLDFYPPKAEFFRFQRGKNGEASLGYADFNGLPAPNRLFVGGREIQLDGRTIGEISCDTQLIGCPITLLGGRLKQLWNLHVDVAVKRDLWQLNKRLAG
jgi:hypothetical protein